MRAGIFAPLVFAFACTPPPAAGSEAPNDPSCPILPSTSLSRLATPVHVPKIDCPAARGLTTRVTITLGLQIDCDGTTSHVVVVQSDLPACNEMAQQALRDATFTAPADGRGQPAGTTIQYRYAFVPPPE